MLSLSQNFIVFLKVERLSKVFICCDKEFQIVGPIIVFFFFLTRSVLAFFLSNVFLSCCLPYKYECLKNFSIISKSTVSHLNHIVEDYQIENGDFGHNQMLLADPSTAILLKEFLESIGHRRSDGKLKVMFGNVYSYKK